MRRWLGAVILCLSCGPPAPTMTPAISRACLPNKPLEGGSGTFLVTSDPRAFVCLNGRHVGSTPVTVRDVGPGRHEVMFLLDLKQAKVTVDLDDGESKKVHHELH